MNVETTIRESILTFPALYGTAGDVLHDILCVVGNGYKWENGEIVRRFTDDRPHWTPAIEEKKWDAELLELVGRQRLDASIAQNHTRVDTVDTLSKDFTLTRDAPFYPQFNSALIMNVPADVTPDWQEAVNLMKQIATDEGWKF